MVGSGGKNIKEGKIRLTSLGERMFRRGEVFRLRLKMPWQYREEKGLSFVHQKNKISPEASVFEQAGEGLISIRKVLQ